MRPSWDKFGLGLLALLLFAESAPAAPPRPRRRPQAPVPVPVPSSPHHPPFAWRQVFAAPSIGDRIRTFTVDPRDAHRIFVGTEEGRILRTTDGGATWLEIDPQPFLIKDRSQGLIAPARPDPADTPLSNFEMSMITPAQRFAVSRGLYSVYVPSEALPENAYAALSFDPPTLAEPLLDSLTASRQQELTPIRSIAICPDARYGVLVATQLELLGSSDGGLSFVRLFANPGGLGLERVLCSEARPNLVSVSTEVGLFTSKNGGLSFDQDLSAWPGEPASAASFGPDTAEGRARLYSASDSDLYVGDPEDPRGFELIYPGSDPDTAPWLAIQDVSVEGDEVWLATADGIRRSLDGGSTFQTVARLLFDRQAIDQIELGQSEDGRRRIAVMVNHTPATMDGVPVSGLHDSMVYSSDDGGETWAPFFFGLSRRTFRTMSFVPAEGERPASWWVATSGEIWTTAPFVKPVVASDRADVAWAKEALERTPPLHVVISTALDAMKLGNDAVEGFADRQEHSFWMPRVDAFFRWSEPSAQSSEASNSVLDAELSYLEQTNRLSRGGSFWIQATWSLGDTQLSAEEASSMDVRLHELRKHMAFAVRDAWHERVVHLELMAEGLSDPLQVLTLKSRIEVLDVLLAVWTGEERWEKR